MASDLGTCTGTRRVLMADNSVQDTPSGLSHVYMHGDDVHNGVNITVPDHSCGRIHGHARSSHARCESTCHMRVDAVASPHRGKPRQELEMLPKLHWYCIVGAGVGLT